VKGIIFPLALLVQVGARLCILSALLLFAFPVAAGGQGQEVHGENSVFSGPGVAIAWGILKGPVEDESRVIVRIASAGGTYAYVSVDGVDPFTQKRQVILDGRALGDRLDVPSLRGSFADFPRREIHLYRTAADWQGRRPAVTVYYLGVPDTTPEFTSESALLTYLAEALAKIQGAGQGRKP
jgi:hypothetical protein